MGRAPVRSLHVAHAIESLPASPPVLAVVAFGLALLAGFSAYALSGDKGGAE